jgi:flavin-dependent dehydrogenase
MSISIVGGGPAGCSTGIFLAKKGFKDIIIYEKFPNRRKPCGGGLSERIVKRYREFVEDVPINPMSECVFDFDNKILNFSFKKPFQYIVDRLAFDKNLRDIAKENGIKIIEKKCDINKINDGVIIDARGFNCSRGNCIGIVAICKLKNSKSTMVYRKRLNPNGYFWIFPISDEYVNMGVGGWIEHLKYPISTLFDMFIKETKSKILERSVGFFSISREINDTVLGCTNNKKIVLRVGDAAKLTNPATGEGIYCALRSGELVASSLLKEDPLRYYINSIKKEFSKDFYMSKLFKKIFISLPSNMQKLTIELFLSL